LQVQEGRASGRPERDPALLTPPHAKPIASVADMRHCPSRTGGGFMAKRLTPIERAIAGEPDDRRKRYHERMRRAGFVRATFMTRPEDADLIKALAKKLRDDPAATMDGIRALLDDRQSGAGRTERGEGAPGRPDAPSAHP
jgi:hypothetical protein